MLRKQTSERGRTVIPASGCVHVILTELPVTAAKPGYVTGLGPSPWKADLVVVSLVLTTGASDVDVHRLPYTRVPRPIYPLDEIGDWRQERGPGVGIRVMNAAEVEPSSPGEVERREYIDSRCLDG